METEEILEIEVDILEFADRDEQPPNAQTYRVRIDGELHTVETSRPTGELLLAKAGKRPCAYELIEELTHRENDVVDPDETVDLRKHGLRGFLTAHKETVIVFIKGNPYPILRGERTVAEILSKVDQSPDGFDLRQEIDGKLEVLPVNVPVCIKGCEVFFTQVRIGTSS